MRGFAKTWPDGELVQQAAAPLPWFQLCTLLDKLNTRDDREWYAAKAIEHGWSRRILVMQIETRRHQRQGPAPTNIAERLPPPHSALAPATCKDRSIFDFLGLTVDTQQRDLERGLVQHVPQFLLALGAGFAVGRQIRLDGGGEEFYIDLLLYHLQPRCYVVVELTATPCKSEYMGQLNFYWSAIDADVKASGDHPTIGLLCKERNRTVTKYTWCGIDKPMRSAAFQPVRAAPAQLRDHLAAGGSTGHRA